MKRETVQDLADRYQGSWWAEGFRWGLERDQAARDAEREIVLLREWIRRFNDRPKP